MPIQKQRDELEQVRLRLEGWARWLHAVQECKLGFPGKTVFAIAPGGKSEFDDEQAEETEEMLVHLRRELPLAFRVVKQAYYFGSSQRDGAERLNLSRVRYCDLKLQGETFLLTYLLMVRKFKKIA